MTMASSLGKENSQPTSRKLTRDSLITQILPKYKIHHANCKIGGKSTHDDSWIDVGYEVGCGMWGRTTST